MRVSERGLTSVGDGRVRLLWPQVVIAFVVSRGVVLAALLISALVPAVLQIPKVGLLGWDAAWYLRIAEHGYSPLPVEATRFFPLLPLLARAVGYPFGGSAVALLLISNVAAFVYASMAAKLASEASPSNTRVAALMPAVVLLSPTAFVLVMGYTEALYGVLVCVVLLYARRGQWWPVIIAGVVAGALRPTGVLLTLPIIVEAIPGLRTATGSQRMLRLAAAVAPLAGLSTYLGYAASAFSDALEPFRAQTASGLRGGVLINPVSTAWHALAAAFRGEWHETPALEHLPWIVGSIALLIVGRRLIPLSYLLFAAATIILGLTAHDFMSFERYAFSAVPLLLIAATLLTKLAHLRVIWAVAIVVLEIYSVASFLGVYVP